MAFQPRISNRRLADLDREVGDFYILVYRYFSSLLNLYGRQVYKERLTDLLREADLVEPEGEFDELVLRNIGSNLTLVDLTIDYFTDPGFHISMQEFFDRIGGQGAWDYLETRVKSPPWEQRWNHDERRRRRGSNAGIAHTEEGQERAEEWLPTIKKDVLDYCRSAGYLPSGFDMDVVLLPPREKASSYWLPEEKALWLGSYGFEFFPENGDAIALPTRAYIVAFHEVAGHAAQQAHSNEMPFSQRFTAEVAGIVPTRPVTEGVAVAMERRGYDFLRQRLGEMGLTEEDVSYVEDEKDLEHQANCENMYYAFTRDREDREEGFSGYEHLLRLTRNLDIAVQFRRRFQYGFFEFLWSFGAVLGQMHYERMIDRVRQEFGEEYPARNERAFHQASLAGVWSWEVYPDAVVYFLRNEDSFVG